MLHYNHNEHYRDLLVRQVPAGCHNALDIGCGDDSLVRLLTERCSGTVIRIDQDRAKWTASQMTVSPRRIIPDVTPATGRSCVCATDWGERSATSADLSLIKLLIGHIATLPPVVWLLLASSGVLYLFLSIAA